MAASESGGFIVTNPNCSAIGLVLALAPLHKQFGLDKIFVVTMQAVSGAGYPGVASLDILGNVVPYIAKEEEKMEEETRKLLGRLTNGAVRDAAFGMSAQCNRVPVEDGHTESVSVKLTRSATAEQMVSAWRRIPLGPAGAEVALRARASPSCTTPRPTAPSPASIATAEPA